MHLAGNFSHLSDKSQQGPWVLQSQVYLSFHNDFEPAGPFVPLLVVGSLYQCDTAKGGVMPEASDFAKAWRMLQLWILLGP